MKIWVALALACLLGRPASAETLAELLARERIQFKVTRGADLARRASSGEVLDTPEIRIVATYAVEGHLLDDHLYVFRLAKARGTWSGAEVRWPKSSKTDCTGGSITRIVEANGYIYLAGHLNPSAECTMVLTKSLALSATLDGWPVAHFADGRIVYEHSEPHFAPTHYAELSIYDPVRRRERQIYPPKPESPLRRQYREKVGIAYARCCADHPSGDCGGSFANRNHHCDPELFNNSVDKVVVSDATDSLAFTALFDDIVDEKPRVTYVFRHLKTGKPAYRERRSRDLERRFGKRSLADYLKPRLLRALFARS
jgi:hypothetical protein